MISVILFLLIILVYGREDTGFGTLQIATPEGTSLGYYLKFINDRVTIEKRASIVNYDVSGAVSSFATGKLLFLNSEGRLAFSEDHQEGFSLCSETTQYGERLLTFGGDKHFELCKDSSIGHKSNCDEAQEILISYQDFNEY